MNKLIIKSENAPNPIGPYSQAVEVAGFVFLSGQVAINPKTNLLVSGSIEDEARQVMENIKAVLEEAKLSFNDVIKSTIFLSDMNDFSEVNKIYGSYFDGDFPARETVAVKGLPKGVGVEISAVAYRS